MKSMVENFTWDESNLYLVWEKPFNLIVERPIFHNGSADGIRTRDFLDENQASWTRLDDGAI